MNPPVRPGVGFAAGAGYVARGFGLWRRRPRLMLLGMVPAALVLVVVVALLVALLLNLDDLVGWATGFADGWNDLLRALLRVGLGLLVVLAALFLATATFTGLTLAVGDPFYERIWRETERMLGGEVPEDGPGFWSSVRGGVVLTAVGVSAAIVVFVLGLLPLVGTVVGAGLGLLVSGWLLGGELLSRPLGARGHDRAAQRDLLRRHRAATLGFGVVTQLFFLVPLGAVVVMPAAVAGATMLARDLLASEPG